MAQKKCLTPKKQRFADLYLTNGFDRKSAYRTLYPTANENTVTVNSYKLLKDEFVAEYIQKRREEQYQELMLDAMRVNAEISKLAFDKDDISDKDKLRALELLSKNLGLQVQIQKVEAKVDSKVEAEVNVYENLTEEQLLALIDKTEEDDKE